ncbi:hypothetical protein [Pseudomonas sp. LD120]|uniref:hypothetical protein n=1 Tax=Pseudomonas sp. LD120 TaxID=485751 RepID=UPI00135ABBFD|nr:hypothetical protein [Pseudomonas sp. LD120]KAF0863517.1 hypothetical protein PLD_22965 [Pseudomonas sp. LD120]
MSSSKMMATLSDHSRGYEYELRKLQQELSKAHERELQLQQQISSIYEQLAGYQLEDGLQPSQEVKALLGQRSEAEAVLRRDLAAVEASVQQHLQTSIRLAEEIESVHTGIDRQLAEDPQYQQQLQSVSEVEALRSASASSYAELRQECWSKLQGFQVDPLYRYLKKRQFGTDQYPRRTPLRHLDQWISRLCNYPENRASEHTLLAIQAANEEAARRLEADQVAQQARLSQLQQQAVASSDLAALQERLALTQRAVQTAKAQANAVQASLEVYVFRRDPYFAKASVLLTGQLAGMSNQKLERLAGETSDAQDDELVKEVRDMRAELDELQVRVPFLQSKCEQAESDYQRAKQLERELLSNQQSLALQASSSKDRLDPLLAGFMKGAFSLAQVASEVSRSSHAGSSSSSLGSQSSRSSSSSWRASSSASSSNASPSRSTGGGFSTSDSL